ncbi:MULTISPECIES: universal stress protein [unclassified Amycolatopsis]|uniref:universal stress protein n=1 Tax=unclassified Amycolatopsis TaxID=2618356 RepID=UPI001C69ED8D|nr:universal stress protein [Amycolatopsis sp. DSM 110486]QYN18531.1 universal stress protein [Amycolatopsis sp. DSM 110486]
MASASTDLVVGVDGSESSLMAARWAARMARERRVGLRLVHAVDEIPVTYPHAAPTYEDAQRVVGERGERVLSRARAAVAEVAPELAAEAVLRPEQPASALRAESASAGMLILGSTGLHRLGRFVLGSVSVSLASHAECPVAFVRPHVAEDAPPVDGPVVVGVDATPIGEDAIGVAFEEASWRRTPLVAVHCWKEGFLASVFEESGSSADADAIEAQERELLAQRLAGWQAKYPDVQVERLVVKEKPADGLLDWADRAQLLVVGSRGRGGLAGLALGSTSQSLISYALCPVLVVRGNRPAASQDE